MVLFSPKMHKFDTIQDTNVKDLKLRPIIDQTGTYIYDAWKAVAEFLKPLARNEFTISDTLYSVVFTDIYMSKMEDNVAAPIKPIFYKRYVDDTYVRTKNNNKDELFEKLKTYHDNIKLTIEENLTKFLDTEIVRHNSAIITTVHTRSKKCPVHWRSKIPLRYKCNVITGELHRAN